MKKSILLALLAFTVSASYAQDPRKHVYHDTVKTVTTRIDFSPDTIPVYFKEIAVTPQNGDRVIYEKWNKGYVIWQTYRKTENSLVWGGSGVSSGIFMSNGGGFYTVEYQGTIMESGTFLYADRKTRVKNKVILSIKR